MFSYVFSGDPGFYVICHANPVCSDSIHLQRWHAGHAASGMVRSVGAMRFLQRNMSQVFDIPEQGRRAIETLDVCYLLCHSWILKSSP